MYVPYVGTWLIFGIVLLPVYMVLTMWFLGKPRNIRLSLMAVSYVIGFITLLWGGLALMSLIASLLFD